MKKYMIAAAVLFALSALCFAACRRMDSGRATVPDTSGSIADNLESFGDRVSEGLSDAGESLRDGISEAGETVSEKLSEAGETLRDGISEASERISEMGTTDRDD